MDDILLYYNLSKHQNFRSNSVFQKGATYSKLLSESKYSKIHPEVISAKTKCGTTLDLRGSKHFDNYRVNLIM